MDDVKKPAPIQPDLTQEIDPVTVHKLGGVESAPISTEASIQSVESGVEKHIESSGERTELQIPDEVSRADVKEVTDEPKISVGAKTAGVKESIPEGPNYGNLPTDPVRIEEDIQGDVYTSKPWRSLVSKYEIAKEQLRNLFNPKKPQEEN